jgi:chromosome segregation protein
MGGVAVADGEVPEAGVVSQVPMAYHSGVKITSPGVVWWPGRARAAGPSAPQMAGKLAASMEELASLQAEVACRETELAEIRVREADAKIESARLETRLEGARKERRRLEEEHSRAQEEVQRMRADLEGLGEEAGRIEEEIRRRAAELERDRARYEEIMKRTAELAALLPGTRESIGALERGIDDVRGRADEVSGRLREVETRLSAARARFEIAREEFAREFATDEARLEELASNPLDDAETMELARLEAKLADLSQGVYLGAVDEFNAIKARYENYTTQVEDLRRSRESLQRAIQRLDRESEKKFDEAFGLIRSNFNLMFRRLFGGGSADLVLQESEEGVRGVDIIAQPPGKRTQTITLLSGGERALISTALLFALFMAKPSPFCLMDEIDAPLDDSNIDRFLKVVKEFSQATQFLIISHNKHTMEVVDNLYGITMEELGVSRIVSVRLKSLQPMGKG